MDSKALENRDGESTESHQASGEHVIRDFRLRNAVPLASCEHRRLWNTMQSQIAFLGQEVVRKVNGILLRNSRAIIRQAQRSRVYCIVKYYSRQSAGVCPQRSKPNRLAHNLIAWNSIFITISANVRQQVACGAARRRHARSDARKARVETLFKNRSTKWRAEKRSNGLAATDNA